MTCTTSPPRIMFRVAAKRAAEATGREWSRRSITTGSCLATEGLEVQAVSFTLPAHHRLDSTRQTTPLVVASTMPQARPWDQVGTNAAVYHAEAVASLFAADRKGEAAAPLCIRCFARSLTHPLFASS